jgi:hypothetical protein
MDDILSQGGDRTVRQWPGRLLAVALLVVLAVMIAWHLPRGQDAPAHHPAIAVTGGPVQLAGLGSGAAGLLDVADAISGRPRDMSGDVSVRHQRRPRVQPASAIRHRPRGVLHSRVERPAWLQSYPGVHVR